MDAQIGCAACQFVARMILGGKPLCYFCARQIIFDMVRRNDKINFVSNRQSSGLAIINYRIEKLSKKSTST